MSTILDPLSGKHVVLPLPLQAGHSRQFVVYVERAANGEFVAAHVTRTPPHGAEVHTRTHDRAEAEAVAARLRITLAPAFDYWGGRPPHPLHQVRMLAQQSK